MDEVIGRIRILLMYVLEDRVNVGLRLLARDAGLQTANDLKIVHAVTLQPLFVAVCEEKIGHRGMWVDPDFGALGRRVKAGRHHADDGHVFAADAYALADHLSVAAKAPLP